MAEPWIQTYTGKKFFFLAPRPENVCLLDIAHSLSRISRFNGNTIGKHGYTVAQHCVLVSQIMDREFALHGLLHDAAEAYTGDITTPYKHILGKIHEDVEERIMDVVAQVFGFERSPQACHAVKKADHVMLATEVAHLVPLGHCYTSLSEKPLDGSFPRVWKQEKAKRKFIEAFFELGGKE